MFNNSNASHLHFLATLEVLFSLFMINKKHFITRMVKSKVFFSFLSVYIEKIFPEGRKNDAKYQESFKLFTDQI